MDLSLNLSCEIVLGWFGAVIPKWPFYYFCFFSPLLPTRWREESELLPCRQCSYILSHLRPQMLLFGSCCVIICGSGCLDNISEHHLVHPTSFTFHLHWWFPVFSWFPLTKMSLGNCTGSWAEVCGLSSIQALSTTLWIKGSNAWNLVFLPLVILRHWALCSLLLYATASHS